MERVGTDCKSRANNARFRGEIGVARGWGVERMKNNAEITHYTSYNKLMD
jgi:hypothetical protein